MKSVVLVILDGFGYSAAERGNAIAQADTPTFDMLDSSYPTGLLQASGIAVGLPWNEPGNSEVGHITMGTGQIRYQPEENINRAIKNGSFFTNKTLLAATKHCKKNDSALHIMGLLGSGSVHSYIEHLWELIELAEKEDVPAVYLHLFLDGRDSPPQEGASLVMQVQERLQNKPRVHIANIVGRHYSMDRNNRWERTQKTYELLTTGNGTPTTDPADAIREQYAQKKNDEFIEPISVRSAEGGPQPTVSDGDALIFFNFREDSARQLSYAFADPSRIDGFSPTPLEDLFFVTFTEYEKDLGAAVAFPPEETRYSLSRLIAQAGKKQFKIAETEKYAHVTYFFNGGNEQEEGEERVMVESHKVENFAETPTMRAKEITSKLTAAIASGEYNFLLANLSNADLLAHTGNLQATIAGVEALDAAIEQIVQAVEKADGTLVITADHGNAEHMLNIHAGETLTEHSSNPVPYWIVGRTFKNKHATGTKQVVGILPDVTVTVLTLLGIDVPAELDGTSLLRRS